MKDLWWKIFFDRLKVTNDKNSYYGKLVATYSKNSAFKIKGKVKVHLVLNEAMFSTIIVWVLLYYTLFFTCWDIHFEKPQKPRTYMYVIP